MGGGRLEVYRNDGYQLWSSEYLLTAGFITFGREGLGGNSILILTRDE